MSGRSHRQQWRRLSVIEPNDNELPGHTNAANGRTRSTRASQRFGTLPAFEVVWSGDFVADERLGFELWEAPGVFRAGSFARPIYRKEETERFRSTSTRRKERAEPFALCRGQRGRSGSLPARSRRAASDPRRRRCAGQLGLRRIIIMSNA